MKDVRIDRQPFDPLTELCAEMSQPLSRPENRELKAIIMLHDAHHGGIETVNVEDNDELISMMLLHLKAMFEARGQKFWILTDRHMVDLWEMPDG